MESDLIHGEIRQAPISGGKAVSADKPMGNAITIKMKIFVRRSVATGNWVGAHP
jgi:hypothetical protein